MPAFIDNSVLVRWIDLLCSGILVGIMRLFSRLVIS